MPQETIEAERNRLRKGVAILVFGIVLILWSWGNWVYRASMPEAAEAVASTQVEASEVAEAARTRAAIYLPQILAYGLILTFVALFGGYAAIRLSRRLRAASERERIKANTSQDVWGQHKVPDYLDDDEPPEPREP